MIKNKSEINISFIFHRGTVYCPTYSSSTSVSEPIYQSDIEKNNILKSIQAVISNSSYKHPTAKELGEITRKTKYPILKITKEKSWKQFYRNSIHYSIRFSENGKLISYWTQNEKGYLDIKEENNWGFQKTTTLPELIEYILNHAQSVPDAEYYLTKDGKRKILPEPDKPRKKKISYETEITLSKAEYEKLCKPALMYLWNSVIPDTNIPEFNNKLAGHFLYELEGGFLDIEIMSTIIEVAKSFGENELLLTDLSQEQPDGIETEMSNSRYIPFSETQSFLESELMLTEKALYSLKGDWGILSSGEGLVVLACGPKFNRKLKKIFPKITNDIKKLLKTTSEKFQKTGDTDELFARFEILMNIYTEPELMKLMSPYRKIKSEYKKLLKERG